MAAAAFLGAAVLTTAGAAPVRAAVVAYFAYAGGAATAPTACPATTVVSSECSLAEALALVPTGGTVLLATPGSSAAYFGNFALQTAGTSPSAQVTIAPATGVSNPTIDGDASATVSCPTKSCTGPALTIAAGVYVTLRSLTIQDANNTTGNSGGCIADSGILNLLSATVTNCQAYNGGGVAVESGASLTTSRSTFSNDVARSYGGAIDNAQGGTGSISVITSQFNSDSAKYHGGAIESGVAGGTGTAKVVNSVFANNTSQHGGAIDNGDGGTGTLNVSGTTFSDNNGTIHGGAIDNGDGNAGKGILNVTSSTFTGNSSPHGGAIDNAEAYGTGSLSVRTSTFTGNSTTAQGAALESGDFHGIANATVQSSTLSANVGNATIDAASGLFQIAGSIVAGSQAANCQGRIFDLGYNLEDDTAATCGFSARMHDIVGVNPQLGTLASNGGPTQTMAPAVTSPLISFEPRPAKVLTSTGSTLYLCPSTDQTGQNASEAYGCSIGAVDPQNSVPVVTSMGPAMGPAGGGNTITLRGGNFVAGDTVQFGTASATSVSVVSATQLQVTVPAFAGPDGSGPESVTVTSPSGLASPPRDSAIYEYLPNDWSAYLGGPQHISYNPSALSINLGTINNLLPIWQWAPPKSPNVGSQADFASPITYGGVIYVGLADGEMYAISESTHKILWSQFLGFQVSTTCTGNAGITATATVAVDPATGSPTVYVNAPDGYLYALDAATGNVVWKSVVGIPSTTQNDYYAWSSPTVANGKVYVGISSRCDNPLVPAGILAFDQSSGTQLAYWDSQPAGVAGGSIWSSVAVLPNGDVVATTGNSAGTNQIANAESIVDLNGTTLSLIDAWQVPKSQQIYDSDFGGSPTIFTAYPAGVPTTMIGACNKDGIYYAFRASDLRAGPVWETQMGAAAGSGAAGGGQCDAAAIWNGRQLIEGGGSPTTIGGISYNGSVQALNPSTGKVVWQTGLPGYVIGTPSADGGGIIAAPVYYAPSGGSGVYLLSASTGAILKFISTEPAGDFAQPVFDGSNLIVGNLDSLPVTVYAVTKPGQSSPIAVSPATVQPGTTVTITISGASNLTSPANVVVSGSAVRVVSVAITSSTTASVQVVVYSSAQAGAALNVTLVEPNLTAYSCTACLTVG